jgi:cytochrome c-type biogenesis protein CcmH
MMRYVLTSLFLLLLAHPVIAGIEVHQFKTEELEARYKKLTHELRCLVCQNQNLADSNAPLAKQLREEAYTMLNKGASDQDVIDFMVKRYGDFVLYSPPLKSTTYLLWIGPFVLLLGAIVIMQMVIRHNRHRKITIDNEEYNKARKLLSDEDTQ